ncbi:hypothetical protein PG985_014666 [Apiospora marii]|uniref:Carbohydrate kinase PfkB domain-containing protein n=1 Tax=Apiospora marii TaxID=335849 RepID=A0ABR1R678_9PEZI
MENSTEMIETIMKIAGKAGIGFCLNAAERVKNETWSDIDQVFLDGGVRNVFITLGSQGAFYANAEGAGHCPAFDVKAKDITSAGYVDPFPCSLR